MNDAGSVHITAVNASIPFGLAVAARELPGEDVDLTALVYDPDRQIMLVRNGEIARLMPWCKHSTVCLPITTFEVDPALLRRARQALASAGHHLRVICAVVRGERRCGRAV